MLWALPISDAASETLGCYLPPLGSPACMPIQSQAGLCTFPPAPLALKLAPKPGIASQDMGAVSGKYIAAAIIPAAIIALLFFFDHSVSSQLAQQVSQ
jgi:hypothetical protein